MENGAYPTNWNFCVSAKWYAESATEFKWASSGSVLYMNEVECAYDGTTEIEAWGTTPAYYWPKQGYLSFHAFSPSSIASATEFDATDGGVKIGSAASLYAFNKSGEQCDIMYSERAFKVKKNDASPKISNYVPTGTDAVQINFKHALSYINFTARRAAEYPNTEITIKSICLKSVMSKGYFVQDVNEEAATPTTDVLAILWTGGAAADVIDYDDLIDTDFSVESYDAAGVANTSRI